MPPAQIISGSMTYNLDPIENYFVGQLERGLASSIFAIGGLESIYKARVALAESRIMEEILSTVLNDTTGNNPYENQIVDQIFQEAIQRNSDSITLREIIRLLCSNASRLKNCFTLLLNLAGDPNKNGLLRRYYLMGAFEIALIDRAKRYTLIGYLMDINVTEDPNYLSHTIKIIGLSFTFFEQEDLFQKLLSLDGCCNEERLYEIAMGWLHKALNAQSRSNSLLNFDNARIFFEQAADLGRDDAKSYAYILEILHHFVNEGKVKDVEVLLEKLQRSIHASSAWDRPDTSLSWTGLRNIEFFNWNTLSSKLGVLLKSLDQPAWFEPGVIIEEYLLQIYSSNRSILNKKNTHGTDLIIQPVLHKRLADKGTQIYLLEQWLSKMVNHDSWPYASQLKNEIQNFKSAWIRGNEEGATDNVSSVVPTYQNLPKKDKSAYEEFIFTYKESQAAGTSKVVKAVFEEICKELMQVASYQDPEVKHNFETITYHSLCFLKLRMDNTKKNHPAMSYLFKKTKMPLECELQLDYYTYLSALPSNGNVHIEMMDVASGRADVLFSFLSHQFCSEVKREQNDCSFENLSKMYLGQALEYSNTSSKLGILLVLDLTDKSSGMGSFESNVKVEISSSKTDYLKRGIVIIKVPGNRLTPSNVKKSDEHG